MSTLERLLRPKTIAVIGGGAWCEAVIAQNIKIGFNGQIWPVHPSKDMIGGMPAFKNVDELPSAPDATFIGVNRNATIELVGALNKIGAGGAVCFASGFNETEDGKLLNEQLIEAAGDMPILGPNCYGLLNGLDHVALWPDQHGVSPVNTGVAIISQSSNIAINLTMQQRGLPISYVLTVGNQSQQSIADIAIEVMRDERVTALGLYIESFGDIQALERLAALSAELNKPIVALKVGRSEESQQATISHTASLSGSSAGSDALMMRLGIASVSSLTALLETLKIFHCCGRLNGKNIASLSCSGGEASVMADTAKRFGLTFPPLKTAQKDTLDTHLSSQVHLSNPLDYHTQIWRNKSVMKTVFAAMTGDNIDMTLIVLDFPRSDKCDIDDWMITVEAVEQAAVETGKPFGVIASMAENMPEDVSQRLIAKGIVPLCDFDASCEAIAAASHLPMQDNLSLIAASDLSTTQTLTEAQAKSALSAFGMDVPKSMGGLPLDNVTEQAEKLGFPLALKGEGVAHKTEAGAVALNLENAQRVFQAAQAMGAKTFLIEEMIEGSVAELLIGVVSDPAHGFVLTLAAGGTLTELLEDRQSLLIPAPKANIERALDSLKINALLKGYRGGKPANRAAIVKSIMQLQDFVTQNATEIAEIEINPLICTSERAIIADALMVKGTK